MLTLNYEVIVTQILKVHFATGTIRNENNNR